MKLYTKQFEHRGYQVEITIHHDEHMGEPWKEHDGHGIVSDWTSRDKHPGELVLNSDHGSKHFYDFAETMKLAKRDGWGLAEKDKAELARKLGRKPTAKQILHASVMQDFEHLRDWCNNEWYWVGYTTEIITPVGATKDGDSCWGIDDEDYAVEEATDNAKADVDRMIDEAAKEQTESHLCACADIQTI